MPPGKKQSPFIGLKESLTSPILYNRYTDVSEILLDPLEQLKADEKPTKNGKRVASEPAKDSRDVASAPKLSKAKKPRVGKEQSDGREQRLPLAVPRTEKQQEGAQQEPNGVQETQKKKKKRKKAGKAEPSGPGNSEEAQRIRSVIGIDSNVVPAKKNEFNFGFTPTEESEAEKERPQANDTEELEGTKPATLPAPPAHRRAPQGSLGLDAKLARVMGEKPSHVARRVFVGGMPFSYEEEDVREYWSYCGEIEDLDLMRFPDTGRFKGIAFITFAEEQGYHEALKYDGEMIDQQKVRVQPCISKGLKNTAAKRSKFDTREQPHNSPAPKTPGYRVAYVGNVDFDASPEELKAIFVGCEVKLVRLHTDKDSGKSKGFAHVHFSDEDSLDRAMNFDGTYLRGRAIKIGYAQPKKDQSSL